MTAFLKEMGEELEFAQVLISRRGTSFELRHVADARATDSALELLDAGSLRILAGHTRGGAFRPLKSAPNLQDGWRVLVHSLVELEQALCDLYPGALADWFAVRQPGATVTPYRDYVNRQTGMYRITQMLSDEQVRDLAHAGCHRDSCLRGRLWGGPRLEPDTPAEKSVIPCLEPCAVLLEFARRSMRLEQEDKVALTAGGGDLQTLLAAVDLALAASPEGTREGDFGAPDNPRRLRRLRIQLQRWLAQIPARDEKE